MKVMGCVQAKGGSYTPTKNLEKLKNENGYAKGGNGEFVQVKDLKKISLMPQQNVKKVVGINGGGEERKISRESGKEGDAGNVSRRISSKKISGDEFVDGWPKWLVDNIPGDVLAGLVPKSADSYDKLAKVSA